MHRPRLTKARIKGLEYIADSIRAKAKARPGTLFSFPRDETRDARRALRYIDDLIRWHRQKDA